ncbi:hypothetical protein AB0L00_17865 [Actinoallomurus sp. NPDC052308]|uniref:hypothetical protein n=1 Tax=Actinoallomurus sp. NPDC052308 TaxID=3155530 RepID=UPI0034308C3D
MFRPLIPLMALACAAGLTACKSTAEPKPRSATSSVPAGPSRPCASAADFVKAIAAGGSTGMRVDGRITCDHGWAAAYMKQSAGLTDPVWAVLRSTGRHWRLVTYGTDGLCDNPAMRTAPASIKKALGPYC